jgi:uncharacterized protein (DUF1330 family)
MNRTITVSVSMLVGAVFGGAAIEVLHAQAKPVFQITMQDVSNPEALAKEFVPLARETIKKNGGKVLAGSAPVMLEGTAPAKRVVVNMWPSMDAVKTWWDSADYKKAREIGNKYAKFTVLLVEGVLAP